MPRLSPHTTGSCAPRAKDFRVFVRVFGQAEALELRQHSAQSHSTRWRPRTCRACPCTPPAAAPPVQRDLGFLFKVFGQAEALGLRQHSAQFHSMHWRPRTCRACPCTPPAAAPPGHRVAGLRPPATGCQGCAPRPQGVRAAPPGHRVSGLRPPATGCQGCAPRPQGVRAGLEATVRTQAHSKRPTGTCRPCQQLRLAASYPTPPHSHAAVLAHVHTVGVPPSSTLDLHNCSNPHLYAVLIVHVLVAGVAAAIQSPTLDLHICSNPHLYAVLIVHVLAAGAAAAGRSPAAAAARAARAGAPSPGALPRRRAVLILLGRVVGCGGVALVLAPGQAALPAPGAVARACSRFTGQGSARDCRS